MALGDGIRRNLASVSEEERDRLRKAIVKLNTEKHYPGQRSDMPVGGVSYWYKQDEIHAHTHVHEAPAFIPWHRELLNRFEASIREIDNELSLHYWNWTKNPRRLPDGEGGFINLFTPEFLGNPGRPDSPKPAEIRGYMRSSTPPGRDPSGRTSHSNRTTIHSTRPAISPAA